MKRFALALPLIALAACNSEPEVRMENASTEEVAREMSKAGGNDAFINPGKWEQTVTLIDIEAPGMPPEAKSMMSRAMGEAQVHEVCLTAEQAKSPREDFFTGADQNCRYEHFNWGDGKIDLKLNCKHPNATQTMVLVGNYEPDSYTMTMTATNVGGGPEEQMVMKMKVDARRTGPCDGKENVQIGN
ncbi:MAG TPA: DUF3617 domain-containing protein [Sphingomicrobium sp.]|nr:DUF3617 domain-containing protein [Sphingomicrobium sp.]